MFGVDGAGLKYKTSWAARAARFEPKNAKWRGFKFGDPERKFEGLDTTLSEGELDAKGRAAASLKLDDAWEAESLINVTLG